MTDPLTLTGDRRAGLLSPRVLAALVVGLVVGGAATYWATSDRGAPAVVRGTVSGIAADSPDGQVRAIQFQLDGVDYPGAGEGENLMVVADVPWTDAAGNNYAGNRPVCLADGLHSQRVQLGLLDVRGQGNWYSP
jgi:hypothetical protein